MRVRILPPFWARWWFIAILAGVISAIVYAGYDFRSRQKKREAVLRKQISDDLHDELGSNLGALSYLLDRMVNRNKLRPEDEASAKVYLSSVQRMIGDLDDVVWLVDPGFDQLGSLVARMQITARSLVQDMELVFTREQLDNSLPIYEKLQVNTRAVAKALRRRIVS